MHNLFLTILGLAFDGKDFGEADLQIPRPFRSAASGRGYLRKSNGLAKHLSIDLSAVVLRTQAQSSEGLHAATYSGTAGSFKPIMASASRRSMCAVHAS